ncbi:MAG: hypothetical protein CMI52_03795 [Parcubacteria group bacterium]|nr:hypothetical protein [Parcubacteria group bacterium]
MKVCSHSDFMEGDVFDIRERIFAAQPHHVIFCTYNEVTNHAAGEVPSGNPGIKITIRSGQLYDSHTFNAMRMLSEAAFAMNDLDMSEETLNLSLREGEDVQNRLTQEVAELTAHPEAGSLTLFVYAGLTARSSALQVIRQTKERFPDASCNVVTCDCNSEHHFTHFTDFIDRLIIDPRCGGRRALRDILVELKD